jgi:naphthoate synthase
MVELFDQDAWKEVEGFGFTDITYHRALDQGTWGVLLTGNGPSPRDGGWAFCSGGDQWVRGRDGYQYASGDTGESIDPPGNSPSTWY